MDANLKLEKLNEDLQSRINKIKEDMRNDHPGFETLNIRRETRIDTLQLVLDTIRELECSSIAELFPNGIK